MYIDGAVDGPIDDYSIPGERWKSGDFALLLRILGNGQRVLVECLQDLSSEQCEDWVAGILIEPTFYSWDSDDLYFGPQADPNIYPDSLGFRSDSFRIVRPDESIEGKTIVKPELLAKERWSTKWKLVQA